MVYGIAYNEPVTHDYAFSAASADVIDQVNAVEVSLRGHGHEARRIPFTRDLARFIDAVKSVGIGAFFNLCETVDEDPTLAGHPAAVLEVVGIPFTGSPSFAIAATTDKLTTKRFLRAADIATPGYVVYREAKGFSSSGLTFPVIVKPRFEDASIGIDQESVFTDEASLTRAISGFHDRFGTVLVEEYIEGREFNVSLFGYPDPVVLPPAEIDFSSLPGHLHRIVGYRAKWDVSSVEYRATPRIFPGDLPDGLPEELDAVARRCFHLFGLRDYGRVDVRVDGSGRVFVLEINANPCITPDAGFPAACREAGMTYDDMIGKLTEYVQARVKIHDSASCHTGQR